MADVAAMRAELVELGDAMGALEPGANARRELGEAVLGHALDFLDTVAEAPSYRPSAEVFSQRLDPEFTAGGRSLTQVLDFIGATVDRPGIATTSPRFMGYIPGGGLFHAGLGDFLAAVSNKYAGFADAGPGAVRIENACIDFLKRAVGYPEDSGGSLTSGGSIANLTAIVVAREARDPDGGGIYTTRYAHYCVDKALKIAGCGRKRCAPPSRKTLPMALGRG